MSRTFIALLWLTSCSTSPIDTKDASIDAPSDVAPKPDASTYASTVLASHPISYLRLGDFTTAFAQDEVSTACQYIGAVVVGVKGAIVGDPNTAAFFNGGHVDLGVDRFDFGTDPFSVELWVSIPEGADAGVMPSIFRVGETGGDGFGIDYETASIAFYGMSAGVRCSVAAMTNASAGFVHVVAVHQEPTITLYIDGVSANASTCSFVHDDAGVSSMIGAASGGTALIGTIDEVAVYDHALTAEEISTHYHVGAGL